jgi:signal transduction histidine kinase/CheY-like chemotaxis protein
MNEPLLEPSKSAENRKMYTSANNDDTILFQQLEKDLVERVCIISNRMIMMASALACVCQYASGVDPVKALNPAIVVLAGLVASCFQIKPSIQGAAVLGVLAFAAFWHSVGYQGCTAGQVPFIYSVFPCAFGFLFRTRRAIYLSCVSTLTLISIIFFFDFSGQCPSSPIDPSDKQTIFADRLIPMVMSILINAAILIIILKQSQHSLQRHAEAAQTASNLAKLRRDLLHRFTHELRTPLNGLVGSVELLTVSDTITDECDLANIMTMKRSLANVLEIADNVLAAAKQSGLPGDEYFTTAKKKPSRLVVARVIDDVADVFAQNIQAKGVQLNITFDGDIRTAVLGFEVKLRQVLLNLVGNATKFTESGSITIQASLNEQPDGKIKCIFAVKDTGIGIDPDQVEALFEPFRQGEQGVTSKHCQGTGLGLTISRDLVRQMGGEIIVSGARGVGSQFEFSLVLDKDTPEKAMTVDAKYRLEPCQIAVVKPDPEELSLFCSIVKSLTLPCSLGVVAVYNIGTTPELIEGCSNQAEQKPRRIYILKCNHSDSDNIFNTIKRINDTGSLVIVTCPWSDFSEVKSRAMNAHAVFRQPFSLERMSVSIQQAVTAKVRVKNPTSLDISPNTPILEQPSAALQSGIVPLSTEPRTSASPNTISTATVVEKAQCKKFTFPDDTTKIVIVDDTLANLKLLKRMLSRLTNASIVSFFDGQSAVRLAEEVVTEQSTTTCTSLLFLVDYHMPGMDGVEVAQAIRRLYQNNNTNTQREPLICLLTADIEGLCHDLEQAELHHGGLLTEQGFDQTTTQKGNSRMIIDAVAGKPVTFPKLTATLTWFQDQLQRCNNFN